jgi:hypothetical protein
MLLEVSLSVCPLHPAVRPSRGQPACLCPSVRQELCTEYTERERYREEAQVMSGTSQSHGTSIDQDDEAELFVALLTASSFHSACYCSALGLELMCRLIMS